MNEETLVKIGLNPTQAKAYLALMHNGKLTPPELAKITGEARTNAYSVLDQLVELGLAKKTEVKKKFQYQLENPVALEKLVKYHRDEALERERSVKNAMPALLNYFYTYSEQPGVRFFQGKDGVIEMYKDKMRTVKTISMVRSPADLDFFGDFEGIARIRRKFNSSSISRHMITPDSKEAHVDWKNNDKNHGNTRTWLKKDDYTAPVEWSVYGDKVGIISFGEEAMGLIIESPQIAESFRQLLKLAELGSKLQDNYQKLPRLASYTGK
jgi:sugar-specific transcriptional regulator TrmB